MKQLWFTILRFWWNTFLSHLLKSNLLQYPYSLLNTYYKKLGLWFLNLEIWIMGIGFRVLVQYLCFVFKIVNPILCNTYVQLVLHEIMFKFYQPWNKKDMDIGFKGLRYCMEHKFKVTGLGVNNFGAIYMFCALNPRPISWNGY